MKNITKILASVIAVVTFVATQPAVQAVIGGFLTSHPTVSAVITGAGAIIALFHNPAKTV